MRKFIPGFCLIIACTIGVKASGTLKPENIPAGAKTHAFCFVENKGQVTDQYNTARTDIQFSLWGGKGLQIFVGNGSIHYQFTKEADKEDANTIKRTDNRFAQTKRLNHSTSKPVAMYRMDVELTGASKNVKVQYEEEQQYYENYVRTGTQSLTAHTFNRAIYKNIYPHIDWVLYIKNGVLKHEFLVHPGGNVSDIKLNYGGANTLKINTDGTLSAQTPMGSITENAPSVYQADGSAVSAKFILKGNELSYDIAAYNGELVIDPTLTWGTYYGGSETYVDAITMDAAQHIYISGTTTAGNNIATTGAWQTSYLWGSNTAGEGTGFIAKFNTSGNIIWGTYYGTAYTGIYALAADKAGNLIAAGMTNSSTNIATAGAFRTTIGTLGTYDYAGMVAKFSPAGTLIWGTYYEGDSTEQVNSVAVDNSNNIYITGQTASRSGIASAGAYQTSYGGNGDAFLAKFNSSGARIWSTYYGGLHDDNANGIALDKTGGIYLTGYTQSLRGIATPGAFKTQIDSGYYITNKAFLSRFDTTGHLVWGTYYGGNGYDGGNCITVDDSGHVIMAGYTLSDTGISTLNTLPMQAFLYSGWDPSFVVKFNNQGQRVWGTYASAIGFEFKGIVTDALSNIYFAGTISNDSGFATSGVYQYEGAGNNDFCIGQFSSTGTYNWGTYFGGSNYDEAAGIVIDSFANVYVAGGVSSNHLATPGAYQDSLYGYQSGFLVKFGPGHCNLPALASITGDTVLCPGTNITLSDVTPQGTWLSNNSDIATITNTGMVSAIIPGTDTLTYHVTNGCGIAATRFVVNVYSARITGDTIFCIDNPAHLSISPASTYYWSTGATTQTITVNQPGIYQVTVTAQTGCTETAIQTVQVTGNNISVSPSGSIFVCLGDSITLQGTGATSYLWSNGATTSSVTLRPDSSQAYTVTGNNAGCSATISKQLQVILPPQVIINGNATNCAGSPVVLTASGAVAYNWSTGSNVDQITVNPTSASTYTVTATGSNTCTASAGFTVTQGSLHDSIISYCPDTSGNNCHRIIAYSAFSSGQVDSFYWSIGDTTFYNLYTLVIEAPGTNLVLAPNYFFNPGTAYTICYTSFGPCGQATVCDTLFTQPLAVQQPANEEPGNIYPNPAHDYAYIDFGTQAYCAEVIIKDITGKQLQQLKLLDKPQRFNTTGLAAGVYLVTMQTSNKTWVKLLVKE